jgi:restriction system protein
MKGKIPDYIPKQAEFINPTIDALHELGGFGKNDEIYDKVIKIMNLSDEAINYPHLGSERQTEVQYKLAWARTYLKAYGILDNSERSVWIITPECRNVRDVDSAKIML